MHNYFVFFFVFFCFVLESLKVSCNNGYLKYAKSPVGLRSISNFRAGSLGCIAYSFCIPYKR
jgi:hypothetical protein